jgi:hypothetical protein
MFAVSCKTGATTTTGAAAREIEAVAAQCLGRFAIPVVARPRLTSSRLAYRGSGAMFVDLTVLGDPDCLRARMEDVTLSRQKTGGNQ